MRMRFFTIFLTAVVLGAPTLAQVRDPLSPRAIRGPAKDHVYLGYRFAFNVSVDFSGLGSLPSPGSTGPADNSIVTEDRLYSDGGWRVDESGNADDSTIDYFWISNEVNADFANQLVTLNSYAAEGDGTASGDADGGYGWEVLYSRDLGDPRERFNWGVLAGFSFDSLEADIQQTNASRIISETGTFIIPPFTGGNTGPTGGGTDDSTTGSATTEDNGFDSRRSDSPPATPAQRQSTGTRDLTGEVEGNYEFEAAFFHLRTGVFAQLDIVGGLGVEVAAGAVVIFAASDFRSTTTIAAINDEAGDPLPQGYVDSLLRVTEITNAEESEEFLFGGFVDLNLFYEVTERVTIYTGVQYLGVGSFDHELENGERAEVDLGGSLQIRSGLGFTF